MQLLPVVRTAWFPLARANQAKVHLPNIELRLALAAVLLIAAIDNLLNSGMILALVLIIGGMSAPAPLGVPALKRHPDRSK
jgi:hypothetical protein